MGSGGKDQEFNSELEWIRFRQDALGDYAFQEEGEGAKFSRKIKENPLVPIGNANIRINKITSYQLVAD